jgi:hypothetical protein
MRVEVRVGWVRHMLQFARLARGSRIALCVGSLALLAAGAPTLTAADNLSSSMRVHYAVEINGFDVGSFEYESQAEHASRFCSAPSPGRARRGAPARSAAR